MKFARLLVATAIAASPLGAGTGFAAAPDCTCTTTGASTGQIVSAKGNVLTNGDKDFVLATAGTPIAPGSEISVGAKSAASISIGTCALPLMANSVTRVSAPKDGNICVASVQTVSAAYGAPKAGAAGSGPFAGSISGIAVGSIVTGAIAAGVLAAIVSNNNNSSTPASAPISP